MTGQTKTPGPSNPGVLVSSKDPLLLPFGHASQSPKTKDLGALCSVLREGAATRRGVAGRGYVILSILNGVPSTGASSNSRAAR